MSGVASLVSSGPLLLAIPVAAAAGAVTFLSPCVLPLVPGFLSYITGMSGVEVSAEAGAGGQAGVGGETGAGGLPGAGGEAGVGGLPAPGEPLGPGAVPGAAGLAEAVAVKSASWMASGTAGMGDAGGRPVAGQASAASASRPTARAGVRPSRRRAVLGTALFVLGFSALFATYGVAFGGLGTALLSHQRGLTQLLGALLIVLGLLFAGVFDRFSFAGRIVKPSIRPRAGLASAPLLGVLFGLGWSPCIGPTLGAVLTLAYTTGTAARGALLAFVYGLGIGIPFLIVAFAFERGMALFGFARRHARMITRIGGLLLIGVGVLEVTGAWTSAVAWLQTHWTSGYTSPL
ncbi:MAG TPA: cytochrome c biogenesis CcdA family protein [Streptosporangiaceae bacterium]|nr:cytochrome c biogenesis CcdA family protein [Streptosporangiaceae bacterium]